MWWVLKVAFNDFLVGRNAANRTMRRWTKIWGQISGLWVCVCVCVERVIEHHSPSTETSIALWTIMIIYVCSKGIRLHCLNCHSASLKWNQPIKHIDRPSHTHTHTHTHTRTGHHKTPSFKWPGGEKDTYLVLHGRPPQAASLISNALVIKTWQPCASVCVCVCVTQHICAIDYLQRSELTVQIPLWTLVNDLNTELNVHVWGHCCWQMCARL